MSLKRVVINSSEAGVVSAKVEYADNKASYTL